MCTINVANVYHKFPRISLLLYFLSWIVFPKTSCKWYGMNNYDSSCLAQYFVKAKVYLHNGMETLLFNFLLSLQIYNYGVYVCVCVCTHTHTHTFLGGSWILCASRNLLRRMAEWLYVHKNAYGWMVVCAQKWAEKCRQFHTTFVRL
jgi:hypothetical protein